MLDLNMAPKTKRAFHVDGTINGRIKRIQLLLQIDFLVKNDAAIDQ